MQFIWMSDQPRTTLLFLAASLSLMLMFAGSSAMAAEKKMIAGVEHIQNPNTPTDGSIDIHLKELWRAGGSDGDLIFGMITQIRNDVNGNIFVMDAQLSQVHVFSPQGDLLRTLFAEGEGPGEIRGPRDLVLMNDGRIGAVQEMPGKLIFVDKQGDPAGSLSIGGTKAGHGNMCQTFSAFTNGDQLLIAGFVQAPGSEGGHMNQINFLSSFDESGQSLVEFIIEENDLDMADFVFDEMHNLAPFWWNAAINTAGDVYVAPYLNRYQIQVFAPDGSLKNVIERDYKPWSRSKADKDYFENMVRAIYHGVPFEIRVKVSDYEPVIQYLHRGLRIHPDGTLWVLTTHGIRQPANGAMATFDVFSTEGVFTRQVNVHAGWNSMSDTIFFLDENHALVVTGFADAMLTQFTSGNMTLDLDDEEGSVEIFYCEMEWE